ncbi:hypothetical protein IV203_037159 [Nitzschia inconspicua]|uniref:SbsA Ig-like domain-containing protein n=1 Tax=Nitzschia inconspicua TaxID=303405 RepID=A0A9K3PXZ5_9STRA|nr:hypothetical protein IV203_037159 [Nitzschia inconspicua]
MKLFVATFIPLLALLPTAFGQFTFSIAGGDPPATWDVQNEASNTVTITFDVSQALETGNTGADFHVDTEECGTSTDDYTITAGLGAAVSDNADPLTVTFTNDIHITATTYCILVKLKADGLSTPVATRQFTYEVSAPTTASVTVDFTMSDLGDVTTNDMAANAAGGITGNVNPGLTAVSLSAGTPVQFGESFTVQLSTLPGFDAQITGITIDCGTAYLTNNNNRQAYPTSALVDVSLPLACFADASRASREVTVAVTWWVNNESVRRLRGLQNTEELPDSGSFEYGLDVEIVPMEDGSSASITKFYYCASAASAGMAAALLL